MRIVAWNCQMGFLQKFEAFHALQPDLAVISECSQKSAAAMKPLGYKALWFGTNPNKGLAVVCREGWSIEAILPPENKWIVPLKVDTGSTEFTLIAVWACPVGNKKADRYIGQLYRALVAHPKWYTHGNAVVAGDWNSNQTWDRERPTGNHSDVVTLLLQRGIVSGYHRYFKEDHGKETRPTCYLYRHQHRPFHIDYVFFPEAWMEHLNSVEVGDFATWSKLSDHSPVIVDFTELAAS